MKNANTRKSRFASLIAVVLIAAMVLSLAACGSKDEGSANAGTKSFTFEVVDPDGKTETFDISSDAATVGEALMAQGLVQGEDGPYGLYVKTVNGITADYDKDQTWWGFYVDGAPASAGVDTTDIVEGSTYGFKVEK